MAVQLENGYTRMANEILEQIALMPLSGTQSRILFVLWRYTYGFQRKEHTLSETFLSKATGISKRHISDELAKLVGSKIVTVTRQCTFTQPKTLAFNKKFDEWNRVAIVQQGGNSSTVEQKQRKQGGNSSSLQGGDSSTKKESLLKKINKDICMLDFEKFYSLYPRAEEKQRTLKNWTTCLKDHKPEAIIKAGMNYKEKVMQAGTGKQYIKTSANFLGRDKFFQDYLHSEMSVANKYDDVKT